MIDEQIHIQPKSFLIGLKKRVLVGEDELKKIDDNIVDLPQLKCVPYCFRQKRWCDRLEDGRLDPVKDGDLLKNLGNNPEIKKTIKKAITAWNYYIQFRNAKIWHREEKDTKFVNWYIKKFEKQYTEKDILKGKPH
jgi:hypothetical protein